MNQSEKNNCPLSPAEQYAETVDYDHYELNLGSYKLAVDSYNHAIASLIQTIENRIAELEEEIEYEKAFGKDVFLQEYAIIQFKHLLTLIKS